MIAIESKELQERLSRVKARFVAGLDRDMVLASKRTAYFMMEYTLPKSTQGNPFPIAPLQDRIMADVKKVFPNVGDAGWEFDAFALIRDNYSEQRAKEWYHDFKRGFTETGAGGGEGPNLRPFDAEGTFAKFRKIPRKIDDKGYSSILKSKSIVKNSARQLPNNVDSLAIVRQGAAENYAKKRQKKAGLAKTAWYSAAFDLGGQRNYKASKFEEGRFVWPTKCATIHRANPGIGGATKSISFSGGNVTLVNRLRYADDAIPMALQQIAASRAEMAMKILFEKRYKAASTYAKQTPAAA